MLMAPECITQGPETLVTLPACHHNLAIFNITLVRQDLSMASQSKKSADTLKFEKLILLILALCLAALVGVQVFRFF